jgi:hypothetical protein
VRAFLTVFICGLPAIWISAVFMGMFFLLFLVLMPNEGKAADDINGVGTA